MNNLYSFHSKTLTNKSFGIIIQKSILEIRELITQLNNNYDTECLHNLRIAIRKLYTILKFLNNLNPTLRLKNEYLNFKMHIKFFENELGYLRDLEVFNLNIS